MTDEVQDIDLRNPSRYFMVFETGDNTTVEVGEAEPLDLFYGRAERFGDDYVVWTETDTHSADATVCYPSDPHDVLDVFDDSGEEVVESDAMARRIWWLDDYVSDTESCTFPGTQTP